MVSYHPDPRPLVGVELSDSDGRRDGALAERVANRVREYGVLIGRTGRHDNVLKIRPPLVFGDAHADLAVEAIASALQAE